MILFEHSMSEVGSQKISPVPHHESSLKREKENVERKLQGKEFDSNGGVASLQHPL